MPMTEGEKLIWAAVFGSHYAFGHSAQESVLKACRAIDELALLHVEKLREYPDTHPANVMVTEMLGIESEEQK